MTVIRGTCLGSVTSIYIFHRARCPCEIHVEPMDGLVEGAYGISSCCVTSREKCEFCMWKLATMSDFGDLVIPPVALFSGGIGLILSAVLAPARPLSTSDFDQPSVYCYG